METSGSEAQPEHVIILVSLETDNVESQSSSLRRRVHTNYRWVQQYQSLSLNITQVVTELKKWPLLKKVNFTVAKREKLKQATFNLSLSTITILNPSLTLTPGES